MDSNAAIQATTPVLEILDQLAPADLHGQACEVCRSKRWYFGHGSHDHDWSRFWKMDLDTDPVFDAIWKHVQAQCEALAGTPLRVIRQYANGHTYGLGGQPHLDDDRPGCYTLLYYPMAEWKDGWDGETVFYDERGEIALAVRPQPNRAIFFDSRILHAGRAPSRLCPALRVTVAYKLEAAPPAALSDGSIRIPAAEVEAAVAEQLAKLGQSVRLPGFRPGKVPLPVLRDRYGAQARSEAIARLAAEAGSKFLSEGNVPSSIQLKAGADRGDVELLVAVTKLSELPPLDLSRFAIERLRFANQDLPAGLSIEDVRNLLHDHLKQQVLDRLDASYPFPLLPAMIEREFAGILKAAQQQIEVTAEAAGELRKIAERRIRLGLIVTELARRYGLRAAGVESLEEKVIDRILGLAQVTEREVSTEELRAMLE